MRIGDPIGERIVGKLPFRIAKATHVVTTEPPSLLLAPLRQRFAFVAPTFGEKPGDKENLPNGSIDSITFDPFAVRANEFERRHSLIPAAS